VPVVQPAARLEAGRAYVRDRLREGAAVDIDAVRRSLARLAQSSRRAHREAAARQLQRLATV
jgi:hypothetical protein